MFLFFHFFLGFPLGVVLMSLVEYWLHRWHMHKNGFINIFLPNTFEEHHFEHHGRYYRQFDHEPDPRGRDLGLAISYRHFATVVLPLLLLLGWACSWGLSAGIAAAILLHHAVWNGFHAEMHNPQGRFFSGWRWYKFVCRYHYLHHKHVNKNFNIVYAGCDWLFGTLARPTPGEVAEMVELGYSP